MAAGALYRAEFAMLLEQRLGLAIQRTGSCFEVKGIPQHLLIEFSKRRAEIEKALNEKGYSSAEASAAATLATRQVKGHVAREELFAKWQETGKGLGWGREEATAFLTEAKAPMRKVEREKAEALSLATRRATEEQSCFTARDFIRYLAEEAQGRGFGASTVFASSAQHLVGSREVIALGKHQGEAVYSTREIMALEAKLLRQVETSRNQHGPGVSETVLSGVAASRSKLSEEEATALRYLCGDGPGTVRIVSGTTEAGRTTLLDAARFAWTLDGFDVQGAALSVKATKGLWDGALIPGDTLTKTLRNVETGTLKLHARSVLVVDEADRIDTRVMQHLVTLTQNARARLVLLGGAEPSPTTQALGPFKEIETHLSTVTLGGLADYAKRGLLSIAIDKPTACEALITDWKVEGVRAPKEQIIFAATRQDAAVLNCLAQEERRKAGALGKDALTGFEGGDAFHVGDRVLFAKQSRVYGVKNGSLGHVTAMDQEKRTLSVRLDRGETATIPLDCFPHVRLGYARSLGRGRVPSAGRAFVLMGESLRDREIAVVQAGRAHGEVRIFADKSTSGEGLARLLRQTASAEQEATVDVNTITAQQTKQPSQQAREVQQAVAKPMEQRPGVQRDPQHPHF